MHHKANKLSIFNLSIHILSYNFWPMSTSDGNISTGRSHAQEQQQNVCVCVCVRPKINGNWNWCIFFPPCDTSILFLSGQLLPPGPVTVLKLIFKLELGRPVFFNKFFFLYLVLKCIGNIYIVLYKSFWSIFISFSMSISEHWNVFT